MSQTSKKGGNPFLISSSSSLTSISPTMRRHKRCYTEWLLACQLFLMVVTVVLSTDSHINEGSVNSDSELLSHSISNPSSGSNKNVPLTDTQHQASENNKPINLTQVWNDVQVFFNNAKNSTDKFLGIRKRDTQAVGKNPHAHDEHEMPSHEMGMESQHQSDHHEENNQTAPNNVTHSIMHEHIEHHEHEGEIDPDKISNDENPAETVRIQDILRQIFVDEIEPQDDGSVDEFSEIDEPVLNDTSFRSSLNVSHHSSNSSVESDPSTKSRQGRADNGGKRRRNTKGSGDSRGSSKKSKGADLAKYNSYMDAVLKRMNTMIKSKRMDPLRVNLYAGPSKKKAGNGNKNKKNSPRMNIDSEEDDGFDDDDSADHGDKEPPGAGPATRDIYLDIEGQTRHIRALLSNVSSSTNKPYLLSEHDEERGFTDSTEAESRGSTSPKSGNGTSSSRTKSGNRGAGKRNGSKEKGAKQKGGSNKNKNSPRPTRGILHGLSTLRRDGNVQVIKQSDKGRLVRAKFLLGPVALEILPKKTNTRGGRGGSQGSKPASATATAPQLKGVLEVRLKQGSPTRIRRLRVYPPGNVKVAGDGKQGGASSGRVTGRGYNKVTPMATYRLRQVAMQVVRHADRLKH